MNFAEGYPITISSFILSSEQAKALHSGKNTLVRLNRAIGTLRLWSSLQRLKDRDLYTEVCARLEATARDTFSQHGWPHSLRIGASS
jgi:hypothetical protein